MDKTMSFIEQLYYSAPFDEMILDKADEEGNKYTDKIDTILTKCNLADKEMYDFTDLITDYAVHRERRGFIEGFKVGMRLAMEALNDKRIST